MAFIIPPAYADSTAYTAGTQVLFNGVVYEAINAILNTNTTDPSQNGTDWKVVAVHTAQDYNSIVEAIRLQLNVRSNPEINDSIPLFIQLTEDSFKTRIRSPQNIARVNLTVDDQSRVMPPGDLIGVINLRLNSRTTGSNVPFDNDIIEIQNTNYERYQRALFGSSNDSDYRSENNSFASSVFWFDNRYFNLAPTYAQGTELELVYYKIIPNLGTTILLTDTAGNPVNANGQTLAQWLAQGGGNTESNFVQGTRMTTRNWFTAAVPQLLIYGACLKAKAYLKNAENRIAIWQDMYNQAESETHDYINSFEDNQAQDLFITNEYANKI